MRNIIYSVFLKEGPSIERRNAFIDIGLSNHFQNHHENIYRTILNHHKGDIVELTENLMRHHSYTISDATSGVLSNKIQ